MKENKNKIAIGGQAVIEGVMLRSPNYYTTSIRNNNGKIISQTKKIKKHPKFWKIPFIRGIVNLIEMFVMGIKTLTWSANHASEAEEESLSSFAITITLITAFTIGLFFFVALPYGLSLLTGVKEETSPLIFNLIDGIIKIAIFLIYLYSISFMKDIKRLFQYHGAEHKTVYCYEKGDKLTVANVNKFSTRHPRCGTSFLFIVLIISVFIFALIPATIITLFPGFELISFWYRKIILFILRILVIPIIAGISYELLKLSGKYHKNSLVRFISMPGMMLQYITTKQPDNKQIEVAINSMAILIKKEKIKY